MVGSGFIIMLLENGTRGKDAQIPQHAKFFEPKFFEPKFKIVTNDIMLYLMPPMDHQRKVVL